ncbi:NTP pyrophosphohydrolase [Streptomyces agglomeratus]|uniref:NUDIX domain-containing protein n=1 Tax=Streptomyces agglomeratus TaxID=285458 RepID=UPI0008527636|nr:NUDIX hydrolase [Streptomyces agglomeratus]OEJ57189.1 NTP pyrophosphohydrolase [Streptomyces agglomeratus]
MTAPTQHGPDAHASVVVARDESGHVAILSAPFPQYGGEYVFLPGGRQEPGENAEECARRELAEEAGVCAERWRHLGTYAVSLNGPARLALYLAEGLTVGEQQLRDTEVDFKLMWWPMEDAIRAAEEERFLLPGGPLALLLANRIIRNGD